MNSSKNAGRFIKWCPQQYFYNGYSNKFDRVAPHNAQIYSKNITYGPSFRDDSKAYQVEVPEFSSENCFDSVLEYKGIQVNPNMIVEYKNTLKIN